MNLLSIALQYLLYKKLTILLTYLCIDFSLVPGAKLLNELDIKLC